MHELTRYTSFIFVQIRRNAIYHVKTSSRTTFEYDRLVSECVPTQTDEVNKHQVFGKAREHLYKVGTGYIVLIKNIRSYE